MKKIIMMAVAALFILGSSAVAVTTYNYSTRGLNSMNHDYAYTWGMATQWSASETVVGATLTFHDLYDWTYETDMLFVNLLDNASIGVSAVYDNQTPIQNYFTTGTYIGSYFDPLGGYANRTDVSFVFDATGLAALQSYALDGNFGIGVDPDCHYYACNTTFDVQTTSDAIPEPATAILMGLGLLGSGIIARRKK